MTKRRYVKLLMASGVDRNSAQAATGLLGKYGKTYEALHRVIALVRKATGLPLPFVLATMGCRVSFAYWKDFNPVWYSRVWLWRKNPVLLAMAAGLNVGTDERNRITAARRNDSVDALSYAVQYLNNTAQIAAAKRAEGERAHAGAGAGASHMVFDEMRDYIVEGRQHAKS